MNWRWNFCFFPYCWCVLERFSLCWLTRDDENFFFSEEGGSLKLSSMRGSYCCCKHTLPLNLCKLNLTCQVFKINLDSLTIPCGLHKLKSLWAKLLKNASGFVFSAGTRKKRCADSKAFVSKSVCPFSFVCESCEEPQSITRAMELHLAGAEPPSNGTALPKHKSATKFRKGQWH